MKKSHLISSHTPKYVQFMTDMCNCRESLDRIITFVTVLKLTLTCRRNHYTTITYHNDNESITNTNNYYDLSHHATHFIS